MRIQVAALSLSAAALVGMAVHEGYREDAYIPVPGDVPTIGFGTTENVKLGDKITPERALVRMLGDVSKFENSIQSCITAPLYQHEYDAFVSLTYNIGSKAFCSSSLVRKVNKLDYIGACQEILKWDKFRGKPLPGLTKRRQEEYRKCLGS